MKNAFSLHHVAEFGDFNVYRRGDWCLSHHVPRFVVSRESDQHILEEFTRFKAASKWAEEQANEGPLVTVHDPRFARMPHLANLP